MAIINSRGVSVGDSVDGAEVIEIGESSVIMEKSGSRFRLEVKKG